MYQQFFQKIHDNPPPAPSIPINMGTNIKINKDYLKHQLLYFDTVSDDNLFIIIREGLNILASQINNNSREYLSTILNYRFLACFKSVILETPNVSLDTKRCCNKLTYDYLTLTTKRDQFIESSFIEMSNHVNRFDISNLKSIGIDEELANKLVVARHSSKNEYVNAKRLNFELCKCPLTLMTLQNIVFIYEKLFNSFYSLFEAVMFELPSIFEDEELEHSYSEIYSLISLAALTILNNMPSTDIERIVFMYTETWLMKGCPKTRFSLKSLSQDFYRVRAVIESLIAQKFLVP